MLYNTLNTLNNTPGKLVQYTLPALHSLHLTPSTAKTCWLLYLFGGGNAILASNDRQCQQHLQSVLGTSSYKN